MTSTHTPVHATVPSRSPHTFITLATAFAGYSALAFAITFPLILHLSSRVPRDLEDSLWYVSALWWNAEVTPLSSRWWDGFSFFPAGGALAFSDHLLGASLIATPLQWLGFSPITAYNLTFLASFPLCAVGAHVLAFTLSRRQDAALICGLAYGFSPYRIAHLEHLELLLAFGMPIALAALHRYNSTRDWKWLVAFAAAVALQGLSGSYYALFFTVLVGLWVLWFVRPRAWRDALAIGTAGLMAALVLAPIAVGYSRIHQQHNLSREFAEVVTYSADVSSFVTASAMSAVWGWTSPLNGGERQLFPGLTITVLTMAGIIAAVRLRTGQRDRLATLSRICLLLSACFVVVALGAQLAGPWSLDVGWLRVSVTVPHKPFSVAAVFAIGAIALSTTMRTAFRNRSPLAFYIVAAGVLFFCSLGPRPQLLGQPVLYEPPYAWLMRLPFFADGNGPVPAVRVPARFAMLGVLALSVAASLAFARFTTERRRMVWLPVVLLGVTADGWPTTIPLPSPERGFRAPAASAAVMELPLGNARADTAAMYRATIHGKPTVNGYHSFAPLSHQILKLALSDRDPTLLDALASFGPIVIAHDTGAAPDAAWGPYLAAYPGITPIGNDGRWRLYELPSQRAPENECAPRSIPIAEASSADEDTDASVVTDGDPTTRWTTSDGQRAGESLIVDLGRIERLCRIEISMGSEGAFYPRTLRVDTSRDGTTWKTRFLGKMGGAAFLGALENPQDSRLAVPLPNREGRFIALRTVQADPLYPWSVADLAVRAQK